MQGNTFEVEPYRLAEHRLQHLISLKDESVGTAPLFDLQELIVETILQYQNCLLFEAEQVDHCIKELAELRSCFPLFVEAEDLELNEVGPLQILAVKVTLFG